MKYEVKVFMFEEGSLILTDMAGFIVIVIVASNFLFSRTRKGVVNVILIVVLITTFSAPLPGAFQPPTMTVSR